MHVGSTCIRGADCIYILVAAVSGSTSHVGCSRSCIRCSSLLLVTVASATRNLQAVSGGMPAKQQINLLVADRSATVKRSGSIGRPLGRYRPRSSIIGTDADTCCGAS